ncbi:MAG: hypothetical protein PHS32_03640 [Rhodoferax sp.]|uniref:hypothetical protein n=1 Tax=Rhodoferax sp. TaxID=50421 RepID=UPI00263752CB|nr:hypothetical protein [Rhodoferax sp.]MDD5332816.1 hypothetical protein [Rhodoferax sp.]
MKARTGRCRLYASFPENFEGDGRDLQRNHKTALAAEGVRVAISARRLNLLNDVVQQIERLPFY